jgi:hypothetical protein
VVDRNVTTQGSCCVQNHRSMQLKITHSLSLCLNCMAIGHKRNFTCLIIIIIIVISFMQCIYTCISETNHVPREYSIAAVLLLQFMVPISLIPVLTLAYFYVSTFRIMCAVPVMAVSCSSLTSWFPGILLTYFLND